MIKDLFISEMTKIKNDAWRNGCLKLIENIPDYFWTTPASTSGKYHPKCDLGDGGLVRHSIMVSRIAVDLVEAEIFVADLPKYRDMARIAALFHDAWKLGDGSVNQTKFEHPTIAADWFFCRAKKFMNEDDAEEITQAIRTHMGKWTTSKYSDATLQKPCTAFEKLIHTADYIASRKYIGGIEEFKEPENELEKGE